MGGRFQDRARLTPLRDGRYYDAAHEYLTIDLDFWRRQARRYGSPVLELACGTGRVAIPLARAGACVTGLDFQMSMLSRAAAKARDAGVEIEWVRADMRRFHLNARFATVILPFNGLCLVHTTSDAERLLGCVRDHLEPRGRFVLDVTNPRLAPLADCAPADTSVAKYQFEDPGGTGVVGATHHARYDRVSQILDVELEYALPDGKTTRDRLRMRMYFPQELRALLQYNGFRVVKAFGDYDESRLESSSERQLLVCELR